MEEVEELTNSIFLAFAEQYHEIENLGYWMRRALFISYVRHYKKNKIKRSLSSPATTQKRGILGKTEKEGFSELIKMLNTFSEEKQKIVRLKIWAHLSFQQIAENIKRNKLETAKIFNNTLLTIKSRLR